MGVKLTQRQQQVYDVLTETNGLNASQIARAADITTGWPAETAAKYAIQLSKLGLADRGGTRMHPLWYKARC